MNRLIFKYLSIVCGAFALYSCTYEYKADIPSDNSIIVIDGRIVAGQMSYITMTKAVKLDGSTQGTAVSFNGRIECEDGTVIHGVSDLGDLETYSAGNSMEFDTRNLDPSKKYKVFLDATQEEVGSFQSDWLTVYSAPVIDKLTCTQAGSGNNSYLDIRVSAHSADSPYFIITYTEAWEHASLLTTWLEYNPVTDSVEEASWSGTDHPYRWCWQESARPITVISSAEHTENRITDAYVATLDKGDIKISVLYRIIINVSSAGKDYFEYWDNLKKVSYVDGDLFTPIPSNMEGNIHRTSGKGAVIGFLGASQAVSDTLFYKNRGFYSRPKYLTDKLNELMYYQRDPENPGDLNEYFCPERSLWSHTFQMGNVPIREASNAFGIIPGYYVWGRKECVDCRYLGGGLEFPEDWPDHNDNSL